MSKLGILVKYTTVKLQKIKKLDSLCLRHKSTGIQYEFIQGYMYSVGLLSLNFPGFSQSCCHSTVRASGLFHVVF